MTTFSANHKPLPEYDVDPARIPEIVDLASRLPGIRSDKARNMGRWLRFVHGVGDPDGDVSSATRATYRKILAQLANDTGPNSPQPIRRGGSGGDPRNAENRRSIMSTDRAAA